MLKVRYNFSCDFSLYSLNNVVETNCVDQTNLGLIRTDTEIKMCSIVFLNICLRKEQRTMVHLMLQ